MLYNLHKRENVNFLTPKLKIELLTLSIVLCVKLFMFEHRLQKNIFLWTLFCIRDLFIGINYVAVAVITVVVFFPLGYIVN